MVRCRLVLVCLGIPEQKRFLGPRIYIFISWISTKLFFLEISAECSDCHTRKNHNTYVKVLTFNFFVSNACACCFFWGGTGSREV